MALFSNGWKGNIIGGLAIGIGSAILAPIIIPILASIAKPVAKASIKGGLMLYQRGQEAFAETQEIVEDLVAEAQVELAEEQAVASTAAYQVPSDASAEA